MAEYHDFFFSFSSLDWKQGKKDDLQKLFELLEVKLRGYGRPAGGFFAPDAISRGKDWEKTLATELRKSRVLVPLYSPNYFNSLYCGKEWQAFVERFDENTKNPPPDVTGDEVILPIIWTADFLKFPPTVPVVQFKADVDPAIYKSRGLAYMMQSRSKYGEQYDLLVDRIAIELTRMAANQGAAKFRHMQPWDDLSPPFPANFKKGLKYVRYVFLAGLKEQMNGVRKQTDAYGIFVNRQDWRPSYPDALTVGDLATSVSNELQKEFEIVEPNNDLLDTLEEAKKRKNIVVVVVDPWSLDLNSFSDFEKKFDAKEFPNSGVLITVNDKDAETQAQLPTLETKLTIRFSGRQARKEFYKNAVVAENLRKELIEALHGAQNKLVEQGGVRSAEPGTSSGQPILNVK
jgi:FxsC-like protein